MGKGGKGKGKSKGKRGKSKSRKGGKKGEAAQVRRELASVVGEVLTEAGEGEMMTDKKGKKGKKNQERVVGPSRRTLRKNKRQEKKQKRAHFFGEAKHQERVEEVSKKSQAQAAASKGMSNGKVAKHHAQEPGSKVSKKRRRIEADDEDITSEEDDPDGKPKKEEDEDSNQDAEAEGEESEEEEENAEANQVEKDVEEEEDEEHLAAAGIKYGERTPPAGGYVPPHLRQAQAKQKGASMEHRRQLRGIINRVTEGNLDATCKELCAVLREIVNQVGVVAGSEALIPILLPAAIGDPNLSLLILGCHASLIVVANVLFGAAIGAAALRHVDGMLRRRLLAAEDAVEEEGALGEDARVARNAITLICLLFSFGMLPGNVIFDLVRFIFDEDKVSEIRVELALTCLRYAGRSLRADCPADFREVLMFVNNAAAAARGTGSEDVQGRIEFLLRELSDLRNNKVSFAVMDRFEQTRTWLTSTALIAHKRIGDHRMDVPFRYLRDPVPDSWHDETSANAPRIVATGKSSVSGDPLRAAAIAQRLTTDLRQSLFVALMGAEDFRHASERILAVAGGAKAGPGEACIVLFHCAVREKAPNPFYEHVANALCERPAPWGKRFCHSMKRAAVQNIQEAHTFGLRAVVNFAELCAALVSSKVAQLPFAIVRFMKFGEDGAMQNAESVGGGRKLGGVLGLLLRHLMESLLHRLADEGTATEIFGTLNKYEDVQEGMLLVLDGLVKPRLKDGPKSQIMGRFRAARRQLVK